MDFFYEVQAFKVFRTATYNVAATYCAPPDNSSGTLKDTVQLLNHGATFKKEMWDVSRHKLALYWNGCDDIYVSFLISQRDTVGSGRCGLLDTQLSLGLVVFTPIVFRSVTLQQDNIGCGESDHPDGLFEVQTQGIVEGNRQIANLLKTGQIGGQAYNKVAYTGFSIGAVAGVSLASQYPDAIDAVILHGYSWVVKNLYPGYLAGLQAPVNGLEKPEWRNISSLYQSQSTPQARQAVVFYGDYDPNILPVDFDLRDMDALGLALSFGYHLIPAPNYTGPVFIGDGNRKFPSILMG